MMKLEEKKVVRNWMKLMFLVILFLSLNARSVFANYVTGFNSGEGFIDGSSIDSVDSWTVDQYYQPRGIATNSPLTAPEGDQYFELSTYAGGHAGTQANRLLDTTERVGSGATNVAWNASFSAWMSVSSSTSMGLMYLRGDNAYGRAEAGVFGFNDGSIYYINGAVGTTGPAILTDTWYKFEVDLRAGGQGVADRWDLKVTDASANVIVNVTDLYFRDSGAVTDVREFNILSSYDTGISPAKLSVDAVTLVPEPITLVFLGSGMVFINRRKK